VTGLAVGGYAFDKLRFLENPALHLLAALLSLLLMASALVAWPIRAARRRNAPDSGPSRLGSAARWTAGAGAALALASTGGIVLVLATSRLASTVPPPCTC